MEGNQETLFFGDCTQSNTSLLYLPHAKVEDSGRLICTAVNTAGSAIQVSHLKVTYISLCLITYCFVYQQ